MSYNYKILSTSKIQPNADFIRKHCANKQLVEEEDFDNFLLTTTRTICRLECDQALRTALFKYQYKLPMKYLKPDPNNRYVSQKSSLTGESNRIETAFKQIEPFNIGFDNYIQLIPINQDIPLGTVFTVDVSNPYDSTKRKFFRSKSIKTEGIQLNQPLKCDSLHIGTLDIGSSYKGRFVVSDKPEYSDCLCKYNFRIVSEGVTESRSGSIERSEIELLWYDFIFDGKSAESVVGLLVSEVLSLVGV